MTARQLIRSSAFPFAAFLLLGGAIYGLSPASAAAPAPAPAPAPSDTAKPSAGIDAWQALTRMRLDLGAAGTLAANFTQTFVPAGFSTGDEESGRVALDLPDCLRWDYASPYPKSYLLCGSELHTWVTGEPQGERAHVEAREEAGLDLLLLPVDRLKERYTAAAKAETGGRIAVELVPNAAPSRILEATLIFDRSTERPTSLAYRDRDGNRTDFRFAAFALVDDDSLFTAPTNIVWQEP
ncbi:MAG: outer membrane lipoprotein carrier protein LolA [Thermoanaerobaculia bacterium]